MSDSKTSPTERPQPVSDSQPVDAVRWRVFLMCFLVVLFDGFDTAAIGYIAPSLMQDWGVAKPALAPVLSAALFGRSLGTAPGAHRLGGGVRRGLSGLGLLAGSDHSYGTALHHRRGTGGGHAQRRHAGQ